MAALCNRGAIIFLPCDFFLSSIFFCLSCFSSPNLIGHRCHTSTHGVALVRIWNAGLKCAARGSLQMQDPLKSREKLPSGQHRTSLSGYIFATKACIDNRKKVLSSNTSSTYGQLWPTNGWDPLASLERPSKCNGFRVLSALLVGVSQTLRHWTEGTTYIRQGGHHVGHSGLFLLTHSVVVYSDTHAADSNFRLIFEYKNLIFAALMQLIPVLFIG